MMTQEFSTWVAVAVQGPAVADLDPGEKGDLVGRVAQRPNLAACDPADQALLREGWAQAMAGESLTYSPPDLGGDWEAEDEAIGVQMKAMYGEDVQWAGL